MANVQFAQNSTSCGLTTNTFTAPVAGPYFIKGKVTLPTITTAGYLSSCVVTINVNGSPIYTGAAGAEGFYTTTTCAANDVIAVVFSSGLATDAALNAIKATIALGLGQ